MHSATILPLVAPRIDALCDDLKSVNNGLIRYRERMYDLVTGS